MRATSVVMLHTKAIFPRLLYTEWRWSLIYCATNIQLLSPSKMVSTDSSLIDQKYERAVEKLNGLQTNAAVLAEIRRLGGRNSALEFDRTRTSLRRVGIQDVDLNQLNAIHVAGTKGKGSVCALCESILRAHGFKTGLYSSPHLLEVRERIRINGRPLTRPQFVKHFWDCYNKLEQTKDQEEGIMPSYFKFLTVLAFSIFLKEKVDVAVVEVGIGGTHDSTNVLNMPTVCAVTSIGYDHTDILGKTLSSIAWYKAGIFKPGRPALTVPQEPDAMAVLKERALELQASSLLVTPDHHLYPNKEDIVVGIPGKHQLVNASLAVQTCRVWLQERGQWPLASDGAATISCSAESVADPFPLPPSFIKGLKECRWPGRCQTLKERGITWYVDGAHTPESLEMCAEWFKQAAAIEKKSLDVPIIQTMVFNFSGRRDNEALMSKLKDLSVSHAVFCPNVAYTDSNSSDQTNYTVTSDSQLQRCHDNESLWKRLSSSSTHVFSCADEAVRWVREMGNDQHHVQVLVTGSLHLVGSMIRVLGYQVEDL